MKYIPTIDLWNEAVAVAIERGNLRLQPGQWVYCGDKENKSRFLAYRNNHFDVIHPNRRGKNGKLKINKKRFKFRALNAKVQREKNPDKKKELILEFRAMISSGDYV